MLHLLLVFATSLVGGAALFSLMVVLATSRNVPMAISFAAYLGLSLAAWFFGSQVLGGVAVPDLIRMTPAFLLGLGLVGLLVAMFAHRQSVPLAGFGAFIGGAGGLGAVIATLLVSTGSSSGPSVFLVATALFQAVVSFRYSIRMAIALARRPEGAHE